MTRVGEWEFKVRLPILSSIHPCGTGRDNIDIKIQPIQDIVRASLKVPGTPLNQEARELVEELYSEVFHKKGCENTMKRSPAGRRGSTSSPGS